MKVKTIAKMQLRLEETTECTQEECEKVQERLQDVAIDEFEKEIADMLCMDSAKVSSLEIKAEIIK